jgi:hypothetical protein
MVEAPLIRQRNTSLSVHRNGSVYLSEYAIAGLRHAWTRKKLQELVKLMHLVACEAGGDGGGSGTTSTLK